MTEGLKIITELIVMYCTVKYMFYHETKYAEIT